MDAWIGGQKDGDGCNSVVDGLQKHIMTVTVGLILP